jgi:hypothetical protein
VFYDLVDYRLIKRRDPRGPGLVSQQTIDIFGHEALLPAPYAGLGFARRHHYRSPTPRRRIANQKSFVSINPLVPDSFDYFQAIE